MLHKKHKFFNADGDDLNTATAVKTVDATTSTNTAIESPLTLSPSSTTSTTNVAPTLTNTAIEVPLEIQTEPVVSTRPIRIKVKTPRVPIAQVLGGVGGGGGGAASSGEEEVAKKPKYWLWILVAVGGYAAYKKFAK